MVTLVMYGEQRLQIGVSSPRHPPRHSASDTRYQCSDLYTVLAPLPPLSRALPGRWILELETNLREHLSFTITEKAPTK